MIEGVDTEFKELERVKGTLPDSVPKEIVAFANTEGGELYVGIRNDGSVVGVSDPDDVMTRISNVAHDTILPDIMPFIQIRPVEMEGKLCSTASYTGITFSQEVRLLICLMITWSSFLLGGWSEAFQWKQSSWVFLNPVIQIWLRFSIAWAWLRVMEQASERS